MFSGLRQIDLEQFESNHMKSTSVSKLPMPNLWYSQYNSPLWPYLKYTLMNSISFPIGKHQHARFPKTNWCSDVLKENNIPTNQFFGLWCHCPQNTLTKTTPQLCNFVDLFGDGETWQWSLGPPVEPWLPGLNCDTCFKQKVPTNKIGGTLPCKESNTLHLDTLYSIIDILYMPSFSSNYSI